MTAAPETARAIAASVRAGTVAATDVVRARLDLIAERNPALRALVAVREPGALADAAAIDRMVASGADPGPLAGVPFTVKDVIATRDLPSSCGSRALAGHETGYDSLAVARLREAGAVLLGKTNSPEFAFGVDTVNDLYGRTANPRGPFTAGGSSGGEAASVAAGFSAFGIGTDFGGSLRWPAQCTGTVGLRPGIGAVPRSGQLPVFGETVDDDDSARDPRTTADSGTLQALVQVTGPITRDVEDSRLVLAVLAGTVAERPESDAPGLPAGSEILFGHAVAGRDAHPDIRACVESAVRALADAGARPAGGLPRLLDEAVEVYGELRAADPLATLAAAVAGREPLLEERTRLLLAQAPRGGGNPDGAWASRRRLVAGLDAILAPGRLLVLPVSFVSPAAATGGVDDFGILLPSRAVSLFGLPAMSVPFAIAGDGSPLSVQLVAGHGREDLLFAAARLVEAAAAGAPS